MECNLEPTSTWYFLGAVRHERGGNRLRIVAQGLGAGFMRIRMLLLMVQLPKQVVPSRLWSLAYYMFTFVFDASHLKSQTEGVSPHGHVLMSHDVSGKSLRFFGWVFACTVSGTLCIDQFMYIVHVSLCVFLPSCFQNHQHSTLDSRCTWWSIMCDFLHACMVSMCNATSLEMIELDHVHIDPTDSYLFNMRGCKDAMKLSIQLKAPKTDLMWST